MAEASLSHKQIVEHLTALAYAVVLAFDTAKDPDTNQASFEDLDEAERETWRKKTHRCLRMLHSDVAEVWNDELDELESAGWTRNFTYDAERKQSPLIRPYDQLPVLARQRHAIYVEIIHRCYL